MFKFGGGLKIC